MTTPNETPTDIPSDIPHGLNPAGETPPGETPESSGAPAAKKRGRPSNAEKAARASGTSTAETIERGSTASAAPGRKPSKNSKRVTASDVGALAKQLVGLHQLGAMISGIPEVMISDADGALLATGIVAVCEEYDLSIDGKTGAALQLLGAMAIVYAPKAFKVSARMSAQKKAAQNEAQQTQRSAEFEMGANGTVYPAAAG